jgi:glycosyltransferase involved in cell wall biosynthesis
MKYARQMPSADDRRLKITFVLPVADLSGGVRVVAIYADRLRQRGHEVTVVSRPHAPRSLRDRLRGLRRGQGWLPRMRREPSHLDGLPVRHHVIDGQRAIINEDLPDADVVVATWWETAEWVAALSPQKGAKAYFIQHHELWGSDRPDRVKATYRLPLHKITISRWLIDLMRDEYGDKDVTLVLNSVDTKQFFAPPRGKQSRPTVGFLYHAKVGWKGGDVVGRVLALAKAQLPDLHVVSFGALPQSAELPLPEGSTFVCRPAQDKIRELYAQCDAWLCGSRAEGFHLPPLEAMACRCPVVSTRVGGPIDIIEEGKQGRLVAVDDVDALARCLVEVLSLDEASWRAMSDAALEIALRYTWDDATTLFEQGLRRAITRRSGLQAAPAPDPASPRAHAIP